jgi:hypothetical protein
MAKTPRLKIGSTLVPETGIPSASAAQAGVVDMAAQTYGGRKSGGNSKVSAGMTNPQLMNSGAGEIVSYWSDSGDANLFDTNNEFDTGTGRFTPKRAGYYQVNAYCGFGSMSAGKIMEFYISKNNTTNIGKSANVAAITETYTLNASCMIYCNGTTDYISLRMYHNDTSPKNITAIMNIFEVF